MQNVPAALLTLLADADANECRQSSTMQPASKKKCGQIHVLLSLAFEACTICTEVGTQCILRFTNGGSNVPS